MTAQLIRRVVIATFVGGIVGMIVGSIADNNGVAITFGFVVAIAALVLMVATAINPARPVGAVDETVANRVEEHVAALVEAGADEHAVRELVRAAVTLGRTAG